MQRTRHEGILLHCMSTWVKRGRAWALTVHAARSRTAGSVHAACDASRPAGRGRMEPRYSYYATASEGASSSLLLALTKQPVCMPPAHHNITWQPLYCTRGNIVLYRYTRNLQCTCCIQYQNVWFLVWHACMHAQSHDDEVLTRARPYTHAPT